jgi:hopanoid biosynthesis associated RND transporter like protein HpnN
MVGFLSFVPTDFQGVSELGVIAGVGMIIAVFLNLTLLPALLTLVRPPAEKEPAGYPWMAGPDRFLARHSRGVLAAVLGLAAAAAVTTAWLEFDFNPLNLKNKSTESVSTMLELLNDPSTTSYTSKILTDSPDAALAVAERLKSLPEVERVVTVHSFVPEQQEDKLFIIEDARFLLEPTLSPPEVAPPPDEAAVRAALAHTVAGLRRISADDAPGSATAHRLAEALDKAQRADAGTLGALAQALVGGIDGELGSLEEALQAQPVTLDDIPQELRRDWVAADGRAVVEIVPKGDARDNDVLRHFARTLLDIVPEASGLPIVIQQSGQTVVDAFRTAGLSALAAIAILLILILRRPLDVLLVLAPPILGGLFTMATWVIADLQINFANIIVLPLMLGIGVAEGVYYVMNWRGGETAPLRSSMTRAVLFSTLTTGTAFGSLAMSSHPGTSGMGLLLTVSLAYTLLSSLIFLPAVFAWLTARRATRAG